MTDNAGSKLCFVTTGATAPFIALIESALSPSTLDTLRQTGFTHLRIQYGTAKDCYTKCLDVAKTHLQQTPAKGTIIVDGLDFDAQGLQAHFKLVQQSKGLVISHAGSGSILEALRYQVALIVVPNTALLGNHQEELAVAMERSNYLIKSDAKNLTPAIHKSEDFRTKMSQFPPITSGKHREAKSFAAIMDETVGFLD